MSLLGRMFSDRPVEFAEVMVGKIVKQFPPTAEKQLSTQGARKRLESILEHIMSDLDQFRAETRLGWIAKARLGNAFRWKLADRGYSKNFVEALTEGVIRHIAAK